MGGFVGEEGGGATGAEYGVEDEFGGVGAGVDAAGGVFGAYDESTSVLANLLDRKLSYEI